MEGQSLGFDSSRQMQPLIPEKLTGSDLAALPGTTIWKFIQQGRLRTDVFSNMLSTSTEPGSRRVSIKREIESYLQSPDAHSIPGRPPVDRTGYLLEMRIKGEKPNPADIAVVVGSMLIDIAARYRKDIHNDSLNLKAILQWEGLMQSLQPPSGIARVFKRNIDQDQLATDKRNFRYLRMVFFDLDSRLAEGEGRGPVGGYSMAENIAYPEHNADRYVAGYNQDGTAYAVVADGVGNKDNPGLAAELAAKAIEKGFLSQPVINQGILNTQILPDAEQAILEARSSVETVGATCVAAVHLTPIGNGKYRLVWGVVGDTRVYVYDRNGLVQLSTDQGRVTNLVDGDDRPLKGTLPDGRKIADVYYTTRNDVTYSLGNPSHDNPNKYKNTGEIILDNGSIVLLSSDGVHDNLTRPQIEDIVEKALSIGLSPEQISRLLVETAKDPKILEPGRKKPDDTTACIIQCGRQ